MLLGVFKKGQFTQIQSNTPNWWFYSMSGSESSATSITNVDVLFLLCGAFIIINATEKLI